MPIYQYQAAEKGCDHCRGGFEQLQKMSDKPLTQCPHCSAKVKKIPARCAGFTPLLSDSKLKEKGFKKLVKKDKGVYEQSF